MSNTYHNPVTPYEILCELSFIISKQSTFKEVSIWLISVWSMHLPRGKFKHLETVIANTQRGRIEVPMLPQIKHCGGKQSNPKDLNFFSWLTMQRLTEGLSESLQKLSGGEQCNLHTIMGKPCTSLRSWDLQTKGTVDTPKVEVTPGPCAISKCDPRFASRDCIDPSLCNSFRFPFVLSRLILSIRIPPLGLRIIFDCWTRPTYTLALIHQYRLRPLSSCRRQDHRRNILADVWLCLRPATPYWLSGFVVNPTVPCHHPQAPQHFHTWWKLPTCRT